VARVKDHRAISTMGQTQRGEPKNESHGLAPAGAMPWVLVSTQ
jgi:hypothetical protein